MPEIARTLRGAAEALRTRGWFQGGWYNGDAATGAVCSGGAICAEIWGMPWPGGLAGAGGVATHFKDAMQALANQLGLTHAADVYRWNDTAGRTVEEVLAAFEAAALAAEEKDRGEATGDSPGQG